VVLNGGGDVTDAGAAEVLVDAALVPNPDAGQELGPESETIGDADLRGSRLLVVREEVAGAEYEGQPYGVVKLVCVFHPAEGARFSWARLTLQLDAPPGVRVLDLTPREARGAGGGEPVQRILTDRRRFGLRVPQAGTETGSRTEFAVYHCSVQGSGISTPNVRWTFEENPHREEGIGREQVLELTLPGWGRFGGTLTASARLVRGGLVRRIRDLVLARGAHQRRYPISFVIPAPSSSDAAS
jgi:hypothetical protein